MSVPLRYKWYPARPGPPVSVLAVQAREMEFEVVAVLCRLLGLVGGVTVLTFTAGLEVGDTLAGVAVS